MHWHLDPYIGCHLLVQVCLSVVFLFCFLFSLTTIDIAVGTALCIGSANSWNQVFEVERDKLMLRTRKRPLPSKIRCWVQTRCFVVCSLFLVTAGALTKSQAMTFASITGALGTGVLCLTSPTITALLACSNIGLYGMLTNYSKHLSFLAHT
jgi:heme O synthase-like polyprenyltransferase